MPRRASSLKFAVAPPSKRRTSEAPGHDHVPPVPEFKADMPPIKTGDTDESPISPISQDNEDEDEEDEDEDEDDVDEDVLVKQKNGLQDEDSDSDAGYQEDSEQSTDEEDRHRSSAPKYPFARSTNYRRRRAAQSPSPPPPAPAVLPPPTRRGRGHIRVDSSCISGKETEGGCSRHRSPPPSKSRSRSNSGGERERIGRLSDAGPRRNRAGSPMPTRILEASSDEEEGESPIKKPSTGLGLGGGWRSDDAAFYGPKSQVKGIRAVSAPFASGATAASASAAGVIISDEDESIDPHHIPGQDDKDGVRSFFRRASEHLPAFRRPRPTEPPLSLDYHTPPLVTSVSAHTPGAHAHGHSHGHGNGGCAPIPIHACPPALDATPALANSIARVETNYSGGLTHRLEKTLSTRVAGSESESHA